MLMIVTQAASVQPSFFSGGEEYNKWMFWIGVIGTGLALIGIAWAIRQSKLAMTAAEAAKTASDTTASRIASLDTMLDLALLTRWCMDVIEAIGSENFDRAIRRIMDVQAAFSQLSATQSGQSVQSAKKWAELKDRLLKIESVVANAMRAGAEPFDNNAKFEAENEMRQIYYATMTLAQKARTTTGAT